MREGGSDAGSVKSICTKYMTKQKKSEFMPGKYDFVPYIGMLVTVVYGLFVWIYRNPFQREVEILEAQRHPQNSQPDYKSRSRSVVPLLARS